VEPAKYASGKPAKATAQHVRAAGLGRETVCTENLTPWRKLLPCGDAAGLAARITPTNVFGARHHALSLQVDSEDIEDRQTRLTVLQTLSVVLDTKGKAWTLDTLLESKPASPCPVLSKPPSLHLDLPLDFGQSSDRNESLVKGVRITQDSAFELDLGVNKISELTQAFSQAGNSLESPVRATRFLLDQDGLAGILVTRIENKSPDPLHVLTHEAIPWWLRVLFHTLNVTINSVAALDGDAVWHTSIHPALDRASMAQIELGVTIPAQATVLISIECQKAFMRQADFPADVSRGLDLPAATIVYQDEAGIAPPVRLYTESVLVVMPFPDFSMPFNVITYVCTLVALFFGSIANVVSMRAPSKDDREEPGLATRVCAGVRRVLGMPPDGMNPEDGLAQEGKHKKVE